MHLDLARGDPVGGIVRDNHLTPVTITGVEFNLRRIVDLKIARYPNRPVHHNNGSVGDLKITINLERAEISGSAGQNIRSRAGIYASALRILFPLTNLHITDRKGNFWKIRWRRGAGKK